MLIEIEELTVAIMFISSIIAVRSSITPEILRHTDPIHRAKELITNTGCIHCKNKTNKGVPLMVEQKSTMEPHHTGT